ncbi:MAG: 50S ribosomal protein L30 [Firmicutes bacterium]|nr:50S ribosomal protein L30 [Bacillota bacterium]
MSEETKKTTSTSKVTVKKSTTVKAKVETTDAKVEKKPVTSAKKSAGKAPYVTNGEIRVIMIGGLQGCTKRQIRTITALGLKKIGDTKIHKDNPAIRGMCRLSEHLVKVEKI